jgi:hypothetical protein
LKEVIGISELWKQQIKKQEKADQLIYQEIQQRRENFDPQRTDILTLLIVARDEHGEAMTDEELRDSQNKKNELHVENIRAMQVKIYNFHNMIL